MACLLKQAHLVQNNNPRYVNLTVYLRRIYLNEQSFLNIKSLNIKN